MNNQLDTISKKLLWKELEIQNYLKDNIDTLSKGGVIPFYHRIGSIKLLEETYKMNPLSFDPEDFEILFNCYVDFDNFFTPFISFYDTVANVNFIKKINKIIERVDTNFGVKVLEDLNKVLTIYIKTYESIKKSIRLINYSKSLLNLKNPSLVRIYLLKNATLLKSDVFLYTVNKYITNLLCLDEYQLANTEDKTIQYQKVLLIIFDKIDFNKHINEFLRTIKEFNEKHECINIQEEFFKENILEIDTYLT